MNKSSLIVNYEIMKYMLDNKINISTLAKETGYSIAELRGACTSGGLGIGVLGIAIMKALQKITGRLQLSAYSSDDIIICYNVIIRNRDGTKYKSYNLFLVDRDIENIGMIGQYAKLMYGGYFQTVYVQQTI